MTSLIVSSPPGFATGPGLKEAQQETEIRLGRCMIRLQQYENLLKALLANAKVEGVPQALENARLRRHQVLQLDTLGTLVNQFIYNHLKTDAEGDLPVENTGKKGFKGRWAKLSIGISMVPSRCTHTQLNLKELVDLRIDLVHHLVERFDLASAEGFRLASGHLDACCKKTSGHYQFLRELASSLKQTRIAAKLFLESPGFEDAFLHGIDPDGSVNWPRSRIVECLRNSEDACTSGGWIALSDAIAFIRNGYSDQIPGK